MKLKKALAVWLASAMVIAMAGCGGNAQESTGGGYERIRFSDGRRSGYGCG